MTKQFPARRDGINYLTEGGQETEVMYKHGFDLPEFAIFPLLDQPDALAVLRDMYAAYLDAVAKHGFNAIIGGLDYRASPDWAGRLGLSASELAEVQLRAIEFLREVAAPYAGRIPSILYSGIVGPRGDAYSTGLVMTAGDAEEYHCAQLSTLARAEVDLVQGMTFNSVPEAVGLARAAARYELPVSISFTLDSTSRLQTGPTLREAIETIDEQTGSAAPAYYGINCSHPIEFRPALSEPGPWLERVRSVRPNAVLAEKAALCTLGHLESGDPEDLGRRMGDIAREYPHIDIWGGCCGTWDQHLDAIAGNVTQARG